MITELKNEELDRYSRLLNLPNWNQGTQLALKNQSVAIDSTLNETIRYLGATGIGQMELFGDHAEQVEFEIKRLNPNVVVAKLDGDSKIFSKTLIYTKGAQPAFLAEVDCAIAVDLEQATLEIQRQQRHEKHALKSSEKTFFIPEAIMCAAAILAVNYLAFDLCGFDTKSLSHSS
jgi:hypothetical protein